MHMHRLFQHLKVKVSDVFSYSSFLGFHLYCKWQWFT